MAFNFNNHGSEPGDRNPAAPPAAAEMSPGSAPPTPTGVVPSANGSSSEASPGGSSPVTSDHPESAAFVRFRSCRWQQPKEESGTEFCTHREVKPYAGTAGFDADAWCPDCQYYKLRRAPKKRNPDEDYSY